MCAEALFSYSPFPAGIAASRAAHGVHHARVVLEALLTGVPNRGSCGGVASVAGVGGETTGRYFNFVPILPPRMIATSRNLDRKQVWREI